MSDDFMKHDGEKLPMHLLPPEFLTDVAKVLAHGAKKYSPENWAKCPERSRYYAALMRHMVAWQGGEDLDPESGLSHLAHAGCCIAFLIAFEHRGIGKDDRPDTALRRAMGDG